MYKKMVNYIIIIVASLLLLGFGFYLGGKYSASFANDSLLKDEFHNYIGKVLLIKFLDGNELEKAREVLLAEQDVAILTVDSIATSQDTTSYDLAKKYMMLVYNHRQLNAQKYLDYVNKQDSKKNSLRQEAQAVLEKWNKKSAQVKP